MNTITVIFTKRKWNPVSWLIRWALPRSRFHLSHGSHCLVKDGDSLIEASMEYGVRRGPYAEVMNGLTIVDQVDYTVPDAEAGLQFARSQVGKPYDFKGAFGIALAPERDWTEPDAWFCYELAAATLRASGRDDFRSVGHISESQLLLMKP